MGRMKLSLAAADLNFNFTLVKREAPREFQPPGDILSLKRKYNAEIDSVPHHCPKTRLLNAGNRTKVFHTLACRQLLSLRPRARIQQDRTRLLEPGSGRPTASRSDNRGSLPVSIFLWTMTLPSYQSVIDS